MTNALVKNDRPIPITTYDKPISESLGAELSAPESDVPTKTTAPTLTFNDVISHWTVNLGHGGPHEAIKSKNVSESLRTLMGMCKAAGLSRGEVSAQKFTRACSGHSKRFSKDKDWQDNVLTHFNDALVEAYDQLLTAPVKQPKTAEEVEDEEFERIKATYKRAGT